jgi:hypothetical protein
MAIIDEYKQDQKDFLETNEFIYNFNLTLDKIELNNVKLTDLLAFVVTKNKQYTLNGFKNYSILVRVEEFPNSNDSHDIQKNVAIYIKGKDKDRKISIKMYATRDGYKFLLNQNSSYFDLKFITENLNDLLEFVFYGKEA